jgi:uncharacterized protein YndB with AHSA1/START domain
MKGVLAMLDIVFCFDVDAPPPTVLAALTTTEGIRGFWTTCADVPSRVGETVEVGFAIASAPFDLRLERSDSSGVVWRTQTYPPHWVGTSVRWDVEPRGGGATVSFRHAGFAEPKEAGRVAFTWGRVMVALKRYAETGAPDPVFV